MAKILLSIAGALPASLIYSFLISFWILYYFSKKKENWKSWIIFIIATLHLSLVFVLPVIVFMVLTPGNEELGFENDPKKSSQAIEAVTMINHALNKIVYPFSIVYYESGFISFKYKIFPTTCKGWVNWILELWIIPAAIILGFGLLFAKDKILGYYNNVLVYYLNYLNIFDLICMYFEFGFSIMDTVRYCSRTCCKRDVYKSYIKGKLIYHKRKYFKEFKKEFDELSSITNSYGEDINKYKLTEIFTFLNKHAKIIENPNYYVEPNSNKNQNPKIENITQKQLEKLISSPCGEIKSLGRKITRINNLENRIIKGIDSDKKCCNCMNKLCSLYCMEIIKIFLFSFICLLIVFLDIDYFDQYGERFFGQNNDTNYTNTTNFISYLINNSTTNNTNTTDIEEKNYGFGTQVFLFFIAYILFFPVFVITTGLYLVPILYAVIKRKFITGELIYGLGFSNNLEIIKSVKKITSMVAASTYLGALFLIHVIVKEKPTLEKYNEFFQFFDIPYTEFVFAVKFLFLVCVMVITNLEYINFQCFELSIADEGTFYMNSSSSCLLGLCNGRKNLYFQLAQQDNLNNPQYPNQISLPTNGQYINIEMYTFY